LVLAGSACDEGRSGPPGPAPSASSTSDPSPRELGRRAAAALERGDGEAIAALLPQRGADVRVEIRDALVETDERTARSLRTREDAREWVAKDRAEWTCAGAGCRWPGGLRTGDLGRCLGDCCFSDWPAGIEKRTLHLRGVCFAAREGGRPRLSYVGFVEAK
jgi:hypothetical protein